MKELNTKNIGEILQETDTDCIIVDKVFASCQQRECFPEIEVDLKEKVYEDIEFKAGFIVSDTLTITDIDNRPDFKRVRFNLKIPYKIITKCGENIKGVTPDISEDIVMYLPDARDEFKFRIVVETASKVLGNPITADNTLTFAMGIFVIAKVVGTVQLLVPVIGYCPPPEECEEYSSENICDEFDNEQFPEDFFPPQLEG